VADLRNLCVEISPRRVQSLVLGDPFIDPEIVNRVMLDAYDPKYLPANLERYGVDFQPYVKAFRPEDIRYLAPAVR